MIDRIASLDGFSEEYKLLNETQRKNFSRIVSKLLNENFLIKDKDSDRADYLFSRERIKLFTNYFELIDYEFIYDKYNELCYIRTTENRNRVRLTKFDTVIILILRQLYYIKRKEVASENKVMVQLEEIIDKVRTSKIYSDDKKINSYADTLVKLRKHKVVDYVATTITENTTIRILPSIQVIVQQDNLEDIVTRLKALKQDVDEGETTDEDTDED